MARGIVGVLLIPGVLSCKIDRDVFVTLTEGFQGCNLLISVSFGLIRSTFHSTKDSSLNFQKFLVVNGTVSFRICQKEDSLMGNIQIFTNF